MSCHRIRLPVAFPLLCLVSASVGCAVGVPVDSVDSKPAATTQAGQLAPSLPNAGGGAAATGTVGGATGAPGTTAGVRAPVPAQGAAGAGQGGAAQGGSAGPSAGGAGAKAGGGGVAVPGSAGGAGSVAMTPTVPGAGTPPVVADTCGSSGLSAGNHSLNLTFAGATRSYVAHIPAATRAGNAQPLLVVMHDWSQTATSAQSAFGLDGTAETEGFVAVYPQGSSDSWNAGTCCGGNSEDSVAFIRAVVADVTAKTCLDRHRIYATGLSNGGMMAYRLACEASDLFAAVAPVGADLRVPHCVPSQPIALIAFNGTADTSVPFRGAVTSVATLRQAMQCSATATTVERLGLDRCDHFSGCMGGVEVTHCTDTGGAHVWSSLRGFDTNALLWKFVSRFRQPG